MCFELLHDTADEFTWRLLDEHRNVIAESPISYATKADCLAAIDRIRQAHETYVLDTAQGADLLLRQALGTR